jgi:microcystin-dependent protein
MSRNISSLYSNSSDYETQVPDLSDNANIQDALHLYHYGADSSTSSPAGIHGHLKTLATSVTSAVGSIAGHTALEGTNVHGIFSADGVIVATNKTQTLTNKTITSSNIEADTIKVKYTPDNTYNPLLPPGTVTMYAGPVIPKGWLSCDGSSVARNGIYADLFAAIGIAYGTPENNETFRLPNFQSRFPIGKSSTYGLGATGGASMIILDVSNIPLHTHNISHQHNSTSVSTAPNHSHGAGTYAVSATGAVWTGGQSADHNHSFSFTETTNSEGDTAGRYDSSGAASQGTQSYGTNTTSSDHSHRYDHGHGFGGVSSLGGEHSHTYQTPTHTGVSGPTGSGTAFSILNPYLSVNFIIKL